MCKGYIALSVKGYIPLCFGFVCDWFDFAIDTYIEEKICPKKYIHTYHCLEEIVLVLFEIYPYIEMEKEKKKKKKRG